MELEELLGMKRKAKKHDALEGILAERGFARIVDEDSDRSYSAYRKGDDYFCNYRKEAAYICDVTIDEFNELDKHLQVKYNRTWMQNPLTHIGFAMPSYFVGAGFLAGLFAWWSLPIWAVALAAVGPPVAAIVDLLRVSKAEDKKEHGVREVLNSYKDKVYFGDNAIKRLY